MQATNTEASGDRARDIRKLEAAIKEVTEKTEIYQTKRPFEIDVDLWDTETVRAKKTEFRKNLGSLGDHPERSRLDTEFGTAIDKLIKAHKQVLQTHDAELLATHNRATEKFLGTYTDWRLTTGTGAAEPLLDPQPDPEAEYEITSAEDVQQSLDQMSFSLCMTSRLSKYFHTALGRKECDPTLKAEHGIYTANNNPDSEKRNRIQAYENHFKMTAGRRPFYIYEGDTVKWFS